MGCGRIMAAAAQSALSERDYLRCVDGALTLAMVHVRSHSRQRQAVATVMTLASVSKILPLQNGHPVGRATSSANCESRMMFFPFADAMNPERVGDPHPGVPHTLADSCPCRCSTVNSHFVRSRAIARFE